MADNSVDSIVTDPPYGLSFMGKKWDYDVPGEDIWRECLRVLKPGGHLLSFAGTRTQHRMACAIEDAGFEIRDMIAWVYGSGFPKSLDVSKAIDKAAGAEREVVGSYRVGGTAAKGKHKGRVAADADEGTAAGCFRDLDITTPATPDALRWQGWGTALKPALEPITVARKPLIGTVAANVLAHGTGALNIDGCRVGTSDVLSFGSRELGDGIKYGKCKPTTEGVQNPQGRFPANLIHDGSDEVLALFPDSKGALAPVYGKQGNQKCHTGDNGIYGHYEQRDTPMFPRNDTGSAARFFYCAKASRAERGEGNVHPTVKPLALMRYLVRLVTRKGGIVLDPFMGSGTTGVAAIQEGMNFIGIEREAEYCEIARARIAAVEVGLFGAAL